jgi:hypothetical protein
VDIPEVAKLIPIISATLIILEKLYKLSRQVFIKKTTCSYGPAGLFKKAYNEIL